MSEALASGDVGQVLRAYRSHPHHGRPLPQQLVAEWLHMSQSTLSRIESGARRHTVDDWVQCARVLGAPVPLPWVARSEPGPQKDDVDPINRRSLIGHAAGSLAATAMSPGAQPTSAADVDPELVPHWLELRGVLTGQDQMFGPHQVVGIATRGLGIIGRHRRAARGYLRTDLMRVEARWEMLVAWLHDDAGNPQAGAAMDRARALATEADDRLMLGYVLMRQSERASRRGDAQEAIGLARAAQRQRGLTAQVRALSALHEALGHALAGDTAACENRLEIAHELVEQQHDGVIDPGWDGLGRHYATRSTLLANEARCWLWLGQPQRAVHVAEDALECWPATRRRGSGLQRAGLALACATAGDTDRAAFEGLRALKIVQATRSQRAMRELQRLDGRLATDASAPGAQEFREALSGALA